MIKLHSILCLLEMGLSNLFPRTLTLDKGLSQYVLRWTAMEELRPPLDAPINFPNQGALLGGLLEFPLLRSPGGKIFRMTTNSLVNPARVVFARILEGQ